MDINNLYRRTNGLEKKDVIKVLLVEDDAIDRKLVERILTDCSRPVEFVIDAVESISEAAEYLGSRKYNIILLDLMLPDGYGIDTVQRLHEINPHVPIVVLTGLDDEQTGLSAIEKGATDYRVKGQSLDNRLVRTIFYTLARKKETEEWWRTFDAISDLVFIQDKDFTITKVNKAFAEAIKSKPEDIIGKKCYEVLHKKNTPWPECPFEKMKKDKESHSEEVCDKNIGFPLLVTTSPILDDEGNLMNSVHIAKDITEIKMAQNVLKKSHDKLEKKVKERTAELVKTNGTLRNDEANLRTIIKQNADGIIIIDPKGIIRFVNDAAESLFGRKKEKLIGEEFGFAVVKGEATEIEVIRKRGEVVTAEMHVVEITWEGEMVYLASLRNITERKKAEEKLKETMKMKSEFTSMVSHELRTPLTAIKEGIALVLDGLAGEINEEQKELLGISKKNVDRLARLINDVLDFQKIEVGKIPFNMKDNDVNAIIKDVYEIMSPAATDIGVDLLVKLNNNLPKTRFDSDKIIQVLTNLVNNAVKFTEKGNITIKTGQRNGSIYVSVSDTGGGIKKKDLPRVFDRFEQLATGGERKTGGTGLGLAISKKIIEQHNGTIWVESVFGKGSKFIFTLPIYSTEELFRTYIDDGIKEASKNDTKISLIFVSIADFDKLEQKLSNKKITSTLKNMEVLLENSLRQQKSTSHLTSDAVFKLSNKVFVVLANCGKENTQRVSKRLEKKLDNYLTGENLTDKIRLLLGYATYPDDAITSEGLINKAKELQPVLAVSSSV